MPLILAPSKERWLKVKKDSPLAFTKVSTAAAFINDWYRLNKAAGCGQCCLKTIRPADPMCGGFSGKNIQNPLCLHTILVARRVNISNSICKRQDCSFLFCYPASFYCPEVFSYDHFSTCPVYRCIKAAVNNISISRAIFLYRRKPPPGLSAFGYLPIRCTISSTTTMFRFP